MKTEQEIRDKIKVLTKKIKIIEKDLESCKRGGVNAYGFIMIDDLKEYRKSIKELQWVLK